MKLTKIAPYFGIVSAILIFCSWSITNTFSNQAQRTASKLAQISNERFVYDELRFVKNEQNQHSRTLYSIDYKVDQVIEKLTPDEILVRDEWNSNEWAVKFKGKTRELQQVQQIGTAITNLSGYIWRLRNISSSIGVEENVSNTIDSLQNRIREINKELNAAGEEIDKKRESLFGTGISANELNKDSYVAYEQSLNRQLESFHTAGREYINLSNGISRLYYRLINDAEKDSIRISRKAKLSNRLALIVYLFGSLFAIYGKVIEVREKEAEKSN